MKPISPKNVKLDFEVYSVLQGLGQTDPMAKQKSLYRFQQIHKNMQRQLNQNRKKMWFKVHANDLTPREKQTLDNHMRQHTTTDRSGLVTNRRSVTKDRKHMYYINPKTNNKNLKPIVQKHKDWRMRLRRTLQRTLQRMSRRNPSVYPHFNGIG